MKKGKYGIIEAQDDLFSKNVRFLRTRKKMSQITFSEKMGMSNNLLYCIEKGFFPGITEIGLANISSYFGIMPEDLFYKDLSIEYKSKRIITKKDWVAQKE